MRNNEQIKIAVEDLTKPLVVDISTDEMFSQRYERYLSDLHLKAQGCKGDPKECEKTYQEIKMVLKELDLMEKGIKNKKLVHDLYSKFEKIMKTYFGKKYAKEKEKESSSNVSSDTKNNTLIAEPPPMQSSPSSPSPFTMPTTSSKMKNFRYICASDQISPDLKQEVLQEYAQRIMAVISNKHPNLSYSIDNSNNEIKIKDDGHVILKVLVSDHLNVKNIMPAGKLYQMYPYHSVEFYQKYWKPIVEKIGHFCIGDPAIILAVDQNTLPDVPRNGNASYSLECWNIDKKEKQNISLSFKGERPIWILEQMQDKNIKTAESIVSKYNELDYLNSIVRCIDPKLKSIYGRTGAAIQVIPSTDIIEIDVDFGRGLDIVRLTEKQIEIVPLGE